MNIARCLTITTALVVISTMVLAKDPNCASPEAWPSSMAFTHLKNAGILDSKRLDFQKTRVHVLTSEKIGRDLYRQVHLVRFQNKSGEQVSAITINEVSHEECSMSNVDVYLVSEKFGNYSNPKK